MCDNNKSIDSALEFTRYANGSIVEFRGIFDPCEGITIEIRHNNKTTRVGSGTLRPWDTIS